MRRTMWWTTASAVAVLCFLGGTGKVFAQDPEATAATLNQPASAVSAYWTANRLRNAKPLDARALAGHQLQPLRPESQDEPKAGGSGNAPVVKFSSAWSQQLFEPAEDAQEDGLSRPSQTSGFGAHFTTTRVFPDAATTTYPYSTAGKLFFNDPRRGDFVCSASVLRPRIVVTAGHCVYNGSTNASQRYFYRNFLFIPAFRSGIAPFQQWTWAYAITTAAWANVGGFPNQQDVAILEMNDRVISGVVRKIGNVTGWLGWQTGGLNPNNITMLGYPCNLDACQRMEATYAESFANGGQNTVIYGSAMKGGSSGGPWIQDFGVRAAGQPPVAFGGNLVKSVTSYQPNNTSLLYLGGSILDNRFVNILNTACAHRAGNC